MPLNVSSWFVDQTLRNTAKPKRKFSIFNEQTGLWDDYTDYVIKWPMIRQDWNKFKPNNATIKLANDDSTFDFLYQDIGKFKNDVRIRVGYTGGNLLTWSESFTQTNSWFDVFNTIDEAGGVLDPDGGINAVRLSCATTDQSLYRKYTDRIFQAGDYILAAKVRLVSFVDTPVLLWDLGDQSQVNVTPKLELSKWVHIKEPMTVASGSTFSYVDFMSNHTSRYAVDIYQPQLVRGREYEDYVTTVGSRVGDEFVEVFKGNINRLSYGAGDLSLSVIDKWDQLTKRIIGDRETPVIYTSVSIADLAWVLPVTFGGLDATFNSANTDLDFASWAAWKAIIDGDSIIVSTNFEGQKVSEALAKIGKMTDSAIFIDENNKIKFNRFTLVNTNVLDLNGDNLLKVGLDIDESNVFNDMTVNFDWDVTSRYYKGTVNWVNTTAVSSFGVIQDTYEDNVIWFVNSSSAINYAQRVVTRTGVPYDEVQAESTLYGLPIQIGETINVSHPVPSVSAGYRITGKQIDLNKGSIKFIGDKTIPGDALFTPFILDVSNLDSTDILT